VETVRNTEGEAISPSQHNKKAKITEHFERTMSTDEQLSSGKRLALAVIINGWSHNSIQNLAFEAVCQALR